MKIISPHDVAPLANDGYPPEADGKVFHRRVFSALDGGPKSIDLDYNNYAGGLGGRLTYAYTKDEFCYTAEGHIWTDSRGVIDDAIPGMFMWRPAGSVTDGIQFKQDSVSLCAFGPAREDEWSHRLKPEAIGKWDGNKTTRQTPIFRHFSTVKPSPYPHSPHDNQIVFRDIFSKSKDGSIYMDIGHIAFAKGAVLEEITNSLDEIWWLETGQLEISCGADNYQVNAKDFLYRAAGETTNRVSFTEDTVVISYSAPTLA